MVASWIDDFFLRDPQLYLEVALPRMTPERTAREVDGLVEALDLQPEERILDLACGHGRHAIELATRGYAHITGLDYTPAYLERAQRDAAAARVTVRWLHGDMRNLPFQAEFDVVYNVFTSLFYFDDETNQAVLHGIGRALRPGGRFLVDTNNALMVIRRGPGQAWEPLPHGGWMLERWHYEVETGRSVNERHLLLPDGRHVLQEFFVRQYTVPELQRMLEAAGLALTALYGDWDLSAYALDSPRLIAVAEKAR